MDVGIGLPSTVPGTAGRQLTEWAKRAEAREFSSLGTIDRVAYPNYEPLVALAAAAAVTERIGLCTSVLLGPLRNPAQLAKQALSVQALSGGRLTLGIGVGAREDDFAVSGVDMRSRGRRVDALLERMQSIWAGGEVGPTSEGAPRLVIGGHADVSFARAARFGEGWIAGGSSPAEYAEMVAKARSAWAEAGREGEPRLMGLGYFALGARAEEDARKYLGHYYGWLGEQVVEYIVGSAVTSPEAVRERLAAFEEAGCGELILFPCASDAEQVDLLADAVKG